MTEARRETRQVFDRNSAKAYIPPTIDRVAQAARERAHVEWRVRSGTLAYGVFEGSGTVNAYRDGKEIEINVIAETSVTLQSMVPHGDFVEGEPVEMVTPLVRPT